MSREEQHAEIGRAVVEHQEAVRELACLGSRRATIARTLAEALREVRSEDPDPDVDYPSAGEARSVIRDMRSASDAVRELRERLRRMGVPASVDA